MSAIRNAWLSLPYAVRAFARDAVEGCIVALGLLNLVIPNDLKGAQAEALLVWGVVVPPIVAAARRWLLPWIAKGLRYMFPAP